jgi:phage replication O-like protein O
VASPQVEDGYTRIANELLEALAQTDISGTQHRVIEMIMRETYGHQRKTVTIGYLALAIKYKIDKGQLIRAMNYLRDHQYLTCVRGETELATNTWSVQKDYALWGTKQGSDCLATSSQLATSVEESLVAKQSPVTSDQTVTTPHTPLYGERNLKKNDDDVAGAAAVVEVLKGLGQTAKQRREIFEKRTDEDGRLTLTLTEAESWRSFLARPPGWCHSPEAFICQSLKAGDPVPAERPAQAYRGSGQIRAGPPMADVPDETDAEIKLRSAGKKAEILGDLPSWA